MMRIVFRIRKRSRMTRRCSRKDIGHSWPTSCLDHVYLGCTQRECKSNEIVIEQYKKMFESRISSGATEKYQGGKKTHLQTVMWSYDTERHAPKSVGRYCELANKNVEQLYKVLAWMITISRKRNLDQLENCQKFAHKLS